MTQAYNLCTSIIKSKVLRSRVINFFRSIFSETTITKFVYYCKTGHLLNLSNPRRYTEKIQWYKLNWKNPIIEKLQDKALVSNYIQSKGYGEILNTVYGVYDNFDQIDFDSLPSSFVLKSTRGNFSKEVILIYDKSTCNKSEIGIKVAKWFPYKKSKIIVEKLLEKDENGKFYDYKFFCFSGKVYCLYVVDNDVEDLSNGAMGFYDTNFSKLPYYRSDYMHKLDSNIDKPKNFNKMLEIAEKLSEDFPHVRVDLYEINNKVIFGELTFYTCGGFCTFEPDEFDFILGTQFMLPKKL